VKITVNFSTFSGGLAPYLAIALLLLSITAGIASVLLFLSAGEMQVNGSERQGVLEDLRTRKFSVPKNSLSHVELLALQKKVKAFNSLTGTTSRTLPLVLATLEKLMPDEVWITNLKYHPINGETTLLVEASRAELLTDFMDRLEQSGSFDKVLLTRQLQQSNGSQRSVLFEIQLQELP
jgi:hypothetical protein